MDDLGSQPHFEFYDRNSVPSQLFKGTGKTTKKCSTPSALCLFRENDTAKCQQLFKKVKQKGSRTVDVTTWKFVMATKSVVTCL